MNKLEKQYGLDKTVPMTQKELNAIFEKPDMLISFKYSYIAKTLLMCLFYMPLFPAGTLISIIGVFFSYFIEKYNFTTTYKRPQMLNAEICSFYIYYFKFFIFVYAIGNWIFLTELKQASDNIFGLISMIFFGALSAIPFHSMFKCDFLRVKESDILNKDYDFYYFDFFRDYERTNPVTRRQGNLNYLEKMKNKGMITEAKFKELTEQWNEDNLNVIECYYSAQENGNGQFNTGKANNFFTKDAVIENKKHLLQHLGVNLDDNQAQANNDGNPALVNFMDNYNTFYFKGKRQPTMSDKKGFYNQAFKNKKIRNLAGGNNLFSNVKENIENVVVKDLETQNQNQNQNVANNDTSSVPFNGTVRNIEVYIEDKHNSHSINNAGGYSHFQIQPDVDGFHNFDDKMYNHANVNEIISDPQLEK
jgi:hypothetical protein